MNTNGIHNAARKALKLKRQIRALKDQWAAHTDLIVAKMERAGLVNVGTMDGNIFIGTRPDKRFLVVSIQDENIKVQTVTSLTDVKDILEKN